MQKAMNSSRALFDSVLAKYGKANNNVIITDSYLLLMKSLQGTLNIINFDVLTNASTGVPPTCIEKRLNITDRFVVRDMAVCIMKAGATTAATQAEINVAVPRTYPNNTVFTGAAEAANLQAVYNGFLTVIIDSIVYYQAYDCRRFYRVPTSQTGVAASTVATVGIINNDGWDILNYAFAPVQPQFEFSGSGNNQVSVTLNQPTLTSGTSSQNFLVAYFRGFLVQNINTPRR